MRGLYSLYGALAMFLTWSPSWAQQTSGQQTPGQTMPDQTTPGQTRPSQDMSPRLSGNSATPRGSSGGISRGGNPATGPISGRVVLSDGAEPSSRIAVQRVCGQSVTATAYADASGNFTIERFINASSGKDASSGARDSAGWDCELRASLEGYRAEAMPLNNGHAGDNDAAVIVLRPIGPAHGMTVTATTLLAPKEARRSYDKGLEAIRHNHPDEAQKDFAGAVQLYPRFAAAWFQLGMVFEQREHLALARNAYSKSIAADGQYLYPYQRLYRLDIRESKWEEAAEASSKVLRLNPYEFPEAYYFNAVSNLSLQDLDAAERSARAAAKLEGSQAEPRGNYVLGVIRWRRGDLDGAAESLQAFLASPPDGPEWESARQMLAGIEKQIARRQAPTAQ